MTRLSERGQIVIPTELRKSMNLKEGERFIIMGVGDTIVLRKLELSQERLRLKKLIRESREKARRVGFSEKEVSTSRSHRIEILPSAKSRNSLPNPGHGCPSTTRIPSDERTSFSPPILQDGRMRTYLRAI